MGVPLFDTDKDKKEEGKEESKDSFYSDILHRNRVSPNKIGQDQSFFNL